MQAAKRKSYREMVETIKSPEDMARFTRSVLDTSARIKLGQLRKPDGKLTETPKETTKVLFDHYCPKSILKLKIGRRKMMYYSPISILKFKRGIEPLIMKLIKDS